MTKGLDPESYRLAVRSLARAQRADSDFVIVGYDLDEDLNVRLRKDARELARSNAVLWTTWGQA